MSPLLLAKTTASIKIEATIALSILVVLLSLPIVSLVSIANLPSLATHALYDAAIYPGDYYAFGNCTYWVSMLRSQAKEPIPNNWGNAINWAEAARKAGWFVDRTPTVGSIMQDSNAPGGEGHVAYVEAVDPVTGSITISEMNRIGFDEVDTRTLSPTDATKYNYIH